VFVVFSNPPSATLQGLELLTRSNYEVYLHQLISHSVPLPVDTLSHCVTNDSLSFYLPDSVEYVLEDFTKKNTKKRIINNNTQIYLPSTMPHTELKNKV